MSEGHRNSPTTLTRRSQPTPRDVGLLHEIVLRAQNNPQTSAKESLLAAYDAVFRDKGLDARRDRTCFWLLLEILKPGTPGATLYEKFETVLEDEGIVLAFDDDPSTRSLSRQSNQSSMSLPTTMNASSRPRIAEHRAEHQTSTAASSLTRNGPEDAGHVRRSQSASSVRHTKPKRHAAVQEDLDRELENPPLHISRLMQTAVAMDRRILLKSVLTQLDSRHLVAMNTTADRLYEYKLKFRVVTHWRNVATQIALNGNYASDLYISGRKLQTLRQMLDAARINRLQAMEDERLRGVSLYKMTMASRESFFHRNMDVKLKRRYLSVMADTFRAASAHQQELGAMLQRIGVQSDLRRLQPAMNKLFHISRERTNVAISATEHYTSKVAAKAANTWSTKTQLASEMTNIANEARKFFLMRKYLFKMRQAVHARRNRRTVLGRWVLGRWRNYVRERKHDHYDAAYKAMRRKVKMNLARRCLRDMATKSADINVLERMAGERTDSMARKRAHRSVVVWYDQSQQAKQLETVALQHSAGLTLKHAAEMLTQKQRQAKQLKQVADQFQDLHVQGVATVCLKTMGRKVFEVRRRQQDADVSRVRHDRYMVRIQLDQWRRKAAENRGEGPLVLPPATPAQRRADQLNRLASTTPQFAPRTSFAARLRGEERRDIHIEEEEEEHGGKG